MRFVGKHTLVLSFLALLVYVSSFSQDQPLDSLKTALAGTENDSVKTSLLQKLVIQYYRMGDYNLALEYALQQKRCAERTGNKRIIGITYNTVGNVYMQRNKYADALKFHLKALNIRTEMHDSIGISASFINLGIVYRDMDQLDKAEDYYRKALEIQEKTGDRKQLSNLYNSLGTLYADRKDYEKAGEYYIKALHEKEKDMDSTGMSLSMSLIAGNYDRLKKYEMAMIWYNKSLSISRKLDDTHQTAVSLNNIGTSLRDQGRYREAISYFLQSYVIAGQHSYLEICKQASLNLSKGYEKLGDMKQAFEFYRSYIGARDSIFNEENTKKMVREEMNYEFQKKEAMARAEQEKKEVIARAESRRQRMILLAVSGFGLLVLGFAVFAYRNFLQKKRTNIEITRQKQIIEEKQKEILDSIHYAKRIQQALLPSEKYIDRRWNT